MKVVDINELRLQQLTQKQNITGTLQTVEINVTEVCNRTCSFCPRGNPKLYPNKKFSMSLDLVNLLCDQLNAFEYDQRIALVGYGEPMLYKDLINALTIIKTKLPKIQWLDINTNGDFLTKENIKAIANAGCTNLIVSMYDCDKTEKVLELVGDTNITVSLKHCYESKFDLKIVNRTDILTQNKKINAQRPCNLPFYKTFIDYNGDVLLCSNDWGRQSILGNITKTSIHDIWLGDIIKTYRTKLFNTREDLNPCSFCDIQGSMYGKEQVNKFKDLYA